MNGLLLRTTALLFLSNLFMNIAWYGHLKWKPKTVLAAILISWGIAFFEYCIAVPANRAGNRDFSPGQLKVLQEALSLLTFIIISYAVLRQPVTPRTVVGMGLILGGVWIAF